MKYWCYEISVFADNTLLATKQSERLFNSHYQAFGSATMAAKNAMDDFATELDGASIHFSVIFWNTEEGEPSAGLGSH